MVPFLLGVTGISMRLKMEICSNSLLILQYKLNRKFGCISTLGIQSDTFRLRLDVGYGHGCSAGVLPKLEFYEWVAQRCRHGAASFLRLFVGYRIEIRRVARKLIRSAL
jgi:hypothetical protein